MHLLWTPDFTVFIELHNKFNSSGDTCVSEFYAAWRVSSLTRETITDQ